MAPCPSVPWWKLALAVIAMGAFAAVLGLAAWDMVRAVATGTAELMARQGGRTVEAPQFAFYLALCQLVLLILLVLAAIWGLVALMKAVPPKR